MSRIITFLGEGGAGHTTVAIATAKCLAQQGRVLLATHTFNTRAEMLLETPLTTCPQVVATPNLEVVQLQTTSLLEQAWQELKQLVEQYLPPAFAQVVHPEELGILPGFDSALAFNALLQYATSKEYDFIVYDGPGGLETLRMLGIPDVLNWYFNRLDQITDSLDLSKIIAMYGGPFASAILSANFDSQKLKQGIAKVREWIDQGLATVNDSKQLTAYLVTTTEPAAIATARWLWGSAQQINLHVGGALIYQSQDDGDLAQLQTAFAPLATNLIPALSNQDWEPLLQALPDFNVNSPVPQPLTVDLAQRQLTLFLPGFNKKQVKLTQYGSGVTIDAGEQRRNIALCAELQGEPIKMGKFEAPYLSLSF